MTKKKQEKEVVFKVNIPGYTPPEKVGEYVLQTFKEQYPATPISADTGTALSYIATQGEKEKMKLKKVKFSLGASWLPINLDFEWEREKR